MKSKALILVGFSLFVSVMACGPAHKISTDKATVPHELRKDQTPQPEVVSSLFIDANREKLLGNINKALQLFNKCLELDPQHAPSMYESARILRGQGNLKEAIQLARNAAATDPGNKWYHLLLADLYRQTGQFALAVNTLEVLLRKDPDNIEYLAETAGLYVQQGKYGNALEIFNHIEELQGVSEDMILKKQNLYILSNNIPGAIEETLRLTELFPHESRFPAMLAELYAAMGQDELALYYYQKVLQIEPDHPYIQVSLAEFYKSRGNDASAFLALEQAFSKKRLDIDAKIQVLLAFYDVDEGFEENKRYLLRLSEILSEVHYTDPRAFAIRAEFLLRSEQFVEARDLYRKAIDLDQGRYNLWEMLIRLDAVNRDTAELYKNSVKATELFPMQPVPFLYAGIAAFQKGNYQRAATLFEEGRKVAADDVQLLADFCRNLGDTYFRLNQPELSDKNFEKCLQINPDDAVVLNNYSYYLALRSERLDEALVMAKRAVEMEPDNKHFLDTYGWVLYKMGQYAEALHWIGLSLQNNGTESAVVLEHYGDALYKLGRKSEAHEFWKKALAIGDGSEFLEKKVRNGVLYE